MSAPMVRAILADAKTVTRRIAKVPTYTPGPLRHPPKHDGPYFDAYCGERKTDENPRGMSDRWCWWTADDRPDPTTEIRCPYGAPGDRLWVKEGIRKMEPPDLPPHEDGTPVVYSQYVADDAWTVATAWPWKRDRLPGIFMPRGLSRITLDVVSVRVERLHDITEEDARAEGVERDESPCDHTRYSCEDVGCMGQTYRAGFCDLWIKINGAESWDANPWVWRIEFRRVEGER